MAVIEDLGLAVSIVVNGTPVAEYDDRDGDGGRGYPHSKYISKYVESKDDTEYAIRCEALFTPRQWLPTDRDNVLGFQVEIDGKSQVNTALTAAGWHRGASQVIEGVTNRISGSHGTLSKFRFSAINALDDANAQKVKEDLKRAKHIGLIRVTVSRALTLHRTTDQGAINALGEKRDLSIAEKAMKGRAVSHGTTFSPATRAYVGEVLDVHWIDPISTPFAVFDFYYRSKDALRSEMIIPRPASPSVPPSLDGVEAIEQLSQEEIHRLARERLAEIRNERSVKREVPGIKREFGQAFEGTPDRNRNVRPKLEQGVLSEGVRPAVKTEGRPDVKPVVIDLLSDSDDD